MRGRLYDSLLLGLTSRWYTEVLERLPPGAALLDVGVGTAGALLANAAIVRRQGLVVTGIDIDKDYIARARRKLCRSALVDQAEVKLESIYEHHGGPYDAIYFSASFMLLPEPERALRHCANLLSPVGRIFFTQTFHSAPSAWMERFKPILKRITTIDFGRVTYENEFRQQISAAGLGLEEFLILSRHGDRAACLAVVSRNFN